MLHLQCLAGVILTRGTGWLSLGEQVAARKVIDRTRNTRALTAKVRPRSILVPNIRFFGLLNRSVYDCELELGVGQSVHEHDQLARQARREVAERHSIYATSKNLAPVDSPQPCLYDCLELVCLGDYRTCL
jgi:hypothetical protein